jgi:hypothetical protein
MAIDMIENGWVSSVQMSMVGDRFANLLDRDQEVAQDFIDLNKRIGLDTTPTITLSTGVEQTVAPYTGKLSDTAPKPNIFNVTQPFSNPEDAKKYFATTTKYSQQKSPTNQSIQNNLSAPIKSPKKSSLLLYAGIGIGLILLVTIIKK